MLLRACDGASSLELPALLRQLRGAFELHQEAKEQVYEAVLGVCRESNDTTTLSLLSIFRTNLMVMSNAVKSFLGSIPPDPTHLRMRFRTVSDSLRSMMDVEEKSVFPLFLRHQRLSFNFYAGAFSPAMRREGEQS